MNAEWTDPRERPLRLQGAPYALDVRPDAIEWNETGIWLMKHGKALCPVPCSRQWFEPVEDES